MTTRSALEFSRCPEPDAVQTLEVPLDADGYVTSWLVAGPQEISVVDLGKYDESHPRPGILEDYHNPLLPALGTPAEGHRLMVEDFHGTASFPWKVWRCGADRFIDFSTFGFTCRYIRSWAWVELISPEARPGAQLTITANGPFDLWFNGRRAHRHVGYHYQIPLSVSCPVEVQQGVNQIAVAFEVIAIRECPYVLSAKIEGPNGCVTRLKTCFPLESRARLERALGDARMERWMFGCEDRICLIWPESDLPNEHLSLDMLSVDGKSVRQSQITAGSGARVDVGAALDFPDGAYSILLKPADQAGQPPMSRTFPMRVLHGDYSTTCQGTYEDRRREALEQACLRGNLFAEIARMELGRWDELNREAWVRPFDRLRRREDCGDFQLVGMLGALHRYGGHPCFPKALQEEIAEVALGYRYWMDEPGRDAMCFHTENHQILFHTCEILAGQLFPDHLFSNAERTGAWHREKGERLAMAWLRKRGIEGFQEWDSNVYLEIDVLALSHLADLAENAELATLASMLLDKIFATLALNSFRGVFGSTHGRAYSDSLKSARLESTAGLSRMLWGMGICGVPIMGVVSLACARSYHLPPAIYELATTLPDGAWSRERHGGTFIPALDCREGSWEVNKVTYKTEDYMLCSAQDLLPGRPGNQQHIWQATLGPEAVVFTTHPVCVGEDSYHRPNFWHGNGILPRVVQWKDFLVALYNLLPNDCLGFTHAYFPTACFDEWILREKWAFARKEDGYVALYASNGLSLHTSAIGLQEELRSYGRQTAWICQMGSKRQDNSFVDFQKQVLEHDIAIKELAVRVQTLRKDELQLGWTGSFYVNGLATSTKGFEHYEGPYGESPFGSGRTILRSRRHLLCLDFKTGQREMAPLP